MEKLDNDSFLQWNIIIDEITNSEGADKELAVSRMIEQIVEYIYKNESYECMDYINEKVENPEVWQRIVNEVRSKTDFFIRTVEVRKFSEDIAIEKIKSSYEYRYKQFENDDYICTELAIDGKQMKAIRCVFNYCGFSIILQHASKRRFKDFLVDKGKFSENITERIWSLFDSDRKNIEKLVYSRHLADLEMKVNCLMRDHDEQREEFAFIEYLIEKSNSIENIEDF